MTTQKPLATDDQANDGEPKKRGRRPTGITRNETFKQSSKNYRKNQLAAGKVELKCFVNPYTKTWLANLAKELAVSSVGEALDLLAKKNSEKE
jgi:hypothetical protein